MSLTITCHCGKSLKVKETSLGKKVRCPGCQDILEVPLPEEDDLEVEDNFSMVKRDEDEDEDDSDPPPLPKKKASRKCDEIDYEIFGNDMQLVEIELDPGEVVIAEAGAMTYMEDGIEFTAKLGDGSSANEGFFKKLWGASKRMITGESMFMTHFTNEGKGKRRVAFGAPYPGKIVPMDMYELGGELICQKNAFLCAALGTKVEMAFQKKFGAGLFGGEGFILQRLLGDGFAFIHACGAIIQKELEDGETLRVDTGCFVAMTPDVEYDIQKAGNLKSMLFGGEGLFLAILTGPGIVWLQSLPFSRLADRVVASAPSIGGKSSGEGSILGGIFRLFGGG
jgi:uncharacterized protein (TIGR00266 family)